MAAVLFRRLTGRRTGFERVWDVLVLVVCVALGTLISALFGVVSLRLGHVIEAGEFGRAFRTWWLGDFSGALVFAPLGLVWATRRSWRISRPRFAEATLLLAILLVLIEVPSQQDVPYVVFPTLIWAALRFGPTGAATAVAIASVLTVWNTAQGSGPFLRASITHSLLATQLFVVVAALTSLVLAAVTAERSASEGAQRRLGAEQSALRRIATLVAGGHRAGPSVRGGHRRGCPDDRGERGQPRMLRLEQHRHVCRCVRASGCARVPRRLEHHARPGQRLDSRSTDERTATGRPPRRAWRACRRAHRRLRLWLSRRRAHQARREGLGRARRRRSGRGIVSGRKRTPARGFRGPRCAGAGECGRVQEARGVAGEDRAGTPGERRRLERNLHDGAQQRLVSLALQLRLVGRSSRKDTGTQRTCSNRQTTSSGTPSTSYASSPAGSIRRHSRWTGSRRRSLDSPNARRSRRDQTSSDRTTAGSRRGGGLLPRRRSDHKRGEICASDTRNRRRRTIRDAADFSQWPSRTTASEAPIPRMEPVSQA